MKKFNLSEIKPELGFKIAHRNVSLPNMRHLLDPNYKYQIDSGVYLESYGINLQRDFVWSIYQKQELIYSILKETFIPQLAVVIYSPSREEIHSIYKIVDGKQRLGSVISFLNNEFPILSGGEEFLFKELPKSIQDYLLRFNFEAQVAYSYWDDKISDKSLIKWFKLINFAGTEQDKKHIEILNSKL